MPRRPPRAGGCGCRPRVRARQDGDRADPLDPGGVSRPAKDETERDDRGPRWRPRGDVRGRARHDRATGAAREPGRGWSPAGGGGGGGGRGVGRGGVGGGGPRRVRRWQRGRCRARRHDRRAAGVPPPGGRAGPARPGARRAGRPGHSPEFRRPRPAGRRGARARKGKGMARPARRPGRQAQVPGLRLIPVGAAALALACANVGDPPGGPPDVAPPKIVSVRPESGAVVPGWKGDAVIHFDEVIDEMAGGGGGRGAEGLAGHVLLSPTSGGAKVSWHRSSISVKPREGWKRGRVYRLEILPGILDLRRNRLDTGKVVLFSTGPAIGHARIGGIALAWVEPRILPKALIEAVPLPDSAGYLTLADSGGQFNLQGLAPGHYIVYATVDENGDRHRGPREAYDSALVTLDSSSNVALFAFIHDTVPPRIRTAAILDSVSVRLEFSQALDAAAPLDSAHVHVLELPDSTPVPVRSIVSQRQYDSLPAAVRAKADTNAARDTSAGKRRVAPPARPAPPPAPPPPPQQQGRPRRPLLQVDTALVRRLLARRPAPSDRIVVTVARPLKPETRYVIRVQGATNLTGKTGDGQVVILVAKPAPADTTRRREGTP